MRAHPSCCQDSRPGIPVCKVGLEVDGCAEVVESAGGLASAEVHQAKVVAGQPLKRAKV